MSTIRCCLKGPHLEATSDLECFKVESRLHFSAAEHMAFAIRASNFSISSTDALDLRYEIGDHKTKATN